MSNENPYETPKADLGAANAAGTETYGEIRPLSFSGRLGRIRYLAYSIVLFVVIAVALLLLGAIGGALFGSSAGGDVLPTALIVLVGVPGLVISVMLMVQRIHDFNITGWLAVLAFVPIVGSIFGLLLLLIPGTDGTNKYGPKTPPNTTGVTVLAIAGFLLVFVGGILAAIAVPAYQDYTSRAQVAEAMGAVSDAKTEVAEYVAQYGRWPGERDVQEMNDRFGGGSRYADVEILSENGVIEVTMRADAVSPSVAGGRLYFEPLVNESGGSIDFLCSSPDIDDRFLPRACR